MSIETLRSQLCARAALFDDPATYCAGVEDALDVVALWYDLSGVAGDRDELTSFRLGIHG